MENRVLKYAFLSIAILSTIVLINILSQLAILSGWTGYQTCGKGSVSKASIKFTWLIIPDEATFVCKGR